MIGFCFWVCWVLLIVWWVLFCCFVFGFGLLMVICFLVGFGLLTVLLFTVVWLLFWCVTLASGVWVIGYFNGGVGLFGFVVVGWWIGLFVLWLGVSCCGSLYVLVLTVSVHCIVITRLVCGLV